MKKRSFVLILALILIIPLAQASITLENQLQSEYNLGEKILLKGSIVEQDSFLGKLKIALVCGSESTDMLLKVFNFQTDEELKFDEEIYAFPTESKLCKVRVSIEKQSDTVEYKDTKTFQIEAKLNTDITLNKKKIQLGEEVNINGQVKTYDGQLIDGSSTLFLKKSSETFQVLSTPIKSGLFSYTLNPAFLESGKYIIEIQTQDAFGNKNTDSISLDVDSKTTLSAQIDPETADSGDEIEIEGQITYQTTQLETDQEITVSLLNQTYKTTTDDNEFDITITVPENINSGQHILTINTIDLYGNQGTATTSISINPSENHITITPTKIEFLPKEDLIFNLELKDQANEVMSGEIELLIENEDDEIHEGVYQSGDKVTVNLPQYTLPGELMILATYEDLETETTVNVLKQKEIDYWIEETDLIIKNTGNIDYVDTFSLVIESNQSYTINKEIDLEPEETVTFDLTDENLPYNTYSLPSSDQELIIPEFDKKLEENKRLILRTSGVLVSIMILAFLVWFLVMRKQHKSQKKQSSKIFNLFQEKSEKLEHHKEVAKKASKKSKKLETGLQHSEKEKNKIKKLFSKYLDPQVAKEIISTGKVMAGEKREITAMFLDVRGFTKLSEKTDPWQVRSILNKYFDKFSKIIQRNKGSINKYIGDAMFILFNAPKKIENHSKAAIISALAIQKEVRVLNEKLVKKGDTQLKVGIGINTGPAVIGGFGAGRRLEYTAIGDTVNVASRLEGLAKKNQILITEEIYEKVSDIFQGEYLGKFKVKNKEASLRVYNIIGFRHKA